MLRAANRFGYFGVMFVIATVASRECPAAANGAETAWTQDELSRGYVVFPHTPLQVLLSGRKPSPPQRPPEGVGPEYVPDRASIVTKVSCAMAQGEYKSVQIGIHALTGNVRQLRLELESDLEAKIYRGIDAPTRQRLLEYANPVCLDLHDVCLDEVSAIDTMDEHTTAIFWITLHADKSTVPGKHPGKIRLQAAGGPVTELDLDITVRAFELQRARIAYAPFYYAEWGDETGPPKFAQTDAWMSAIFRDIAEHSHTSLIGVGYSVPGASIDFSTIPPSDNRTFNFLFPVAQQVGLISPEIPIFHFGHNLKQLPEKPGDLTLPQQEEAMRWYESQRHERGWPELIAYGQDEPAYPNPGLRGRYGPLRGVGMRVGTAMFGPAAFGLGDLHDIWIVRSGEITLEMCAEAQRQGAEVWTYHCDAMSNRPLFERHFAGLYVWAYGLRGHTTWHYYAQEEFKLVWMREEDQRPMPTIGWEMRREGIDDYRYLQMLGDSLAAHPDHPAAAAATEWLAALRARVLANDEHIAAKPATPLPWEEYEQIRDQAAQYILLLGTVPNDRATPPASMRIKDEAKLFRGQSLEACLGGLDSPHESERRAAAWSLCERGAEGAPGVGRLAELLAEQGTRIPAMRALEAIGPAARAALPALNGLAHHPDGFVRLGATIAARGIGEPPK